MLFKHLDIVFTIIAFLFLLLWVATIYSSHVNSRSAVDGPQKEEHHPASILLAPITFLIFITAGGFFFLATALFYATIFILFPLLLIGIRKSFLVVLVQKMLLRIGQPLLKANSFLMKQKLP